MTVYLSTLNLEKYLRILEGKRPLVRMTDANEILLTAFEKKGWVASFGEDGKEDGMYRVYGKRKNKK